MAQGGVMSVPSYFYYLVFIIVKKSECGWNTGFDYLPCNVTLCEVVKWFTRQIFNEKEEEIELLLVYSAVAPNEIAHYFVV